VILLHLLKVFVCSHQFNPINLNNQAINASDSLSPPWRSIEPMTEFQEHNHLFIPRTMAGEAPLDVHLSHRYPAMKVTRD